MSLAGLFASAPTVVKHAEEREPVIVPDTEENKPYLDKKLSLAQIKEREAKTVFVGNVPLQCKHKTIKKHFGKYGTVESVWFRSIPVASETKVPIRGKVATKTFSDNNDSMNCYILFSDVKEAEAATEENNKEFLGKYLRVTLANQKEHDVKTTIFVGNLYYKTKDDELREFFKQCGEVHSVRIIRDPVTHMGKGFAYVRFANKNGYLEGLKKNKSEFMQRELRIKKAVEIQQENKTKDFLEKERREKRDLMRSKSGDTVKMNQEDLEALKKENEHMRKFTEKRNMEDEMTAERAEEIYKTKGKIPQNMIRGQLKKIKKEGVNTGLILAERS
jgi:nucleolar protein 12